jgi:hypothetical protein
VALERAARINSLTIPITLIIENCAVRSDGMIFAVEENDSAHEAMLLGIDGATGLARTRVPILESTWEYYDSSCALDIYQRGPAQTGAPIITPDGAVHLEGDVWHRLDGQTQCLGASENSTFDDNVLLLQVASDGTPSWSAPLSTSSWSTFMDLGATIPDGEGGLLASRAVCQYNYNGYYYYCFPHLSHVTAGGNTDYAFALDPSMSEISSMVLGENGTAFASDGSKFVSFDIASGNVNWTWTAPSGGELMAATAGNGLVVKLYNFDGSGGETDQVVRLDPTGAATPDSWTGNSIQYAFGDLWLEPGNAGVSADPIVYAANPYTTAGGYEDSGGSQPECAPLPVTAFDPKGNTIYPRSWIAQSFTDLLTYTQQSCAFCDQYILGKLPTPPSTKLVIDKTEMGFHNFLAGGHQYCDGSQSGLKVEWFKNSMLDTDFEKYRNGPIKDYFKAENPDLNKPGLTAITVSRVEYKNIPVPIYAFFLPSAISNSEGRNMSLLYHEGLHSFGDWGDGDLCQLVESPRNDPNYTDSPFYIINCDGDRSQFNDWLYYYDVPPNTTIFSGP